MTREGSPASRRRRTGSAHSAQARATAEAKAAWLQAFASSYTVSSACRVAGVGRRTVYEWRQQDEDFAVAWADIDEANVEELEAEARRRAYEGVVKPVTVAGARDEVREFSNDLLMFLLKARRPEKYRDRATVRHEGSIDLGDLAPERLRDLSDEELAALKAAVREKRTA